MSAFLPGALLCACGGRTPLDLFSITGAAGDAGLGAGASDAGGGRALDGSLDAGAVTDAMLDAPVLPSNPPCSAPLGVQPGAPWPIAGRCPARAGYAGAVGPASAHVAWQLRGNRFGPEVVVAADGTLYATDSNEILAVTHEGAVKWRTLVSEPVGSQPLSLAIGPDGTLYVWNGVMTALRPDGSAAWTWTGYADAGYLPSPNPIEMGWDGTIYVIDGLPGAVSQLHAIDPSGAVAWTYAFPDGVGPSGQIAVGTGGTIYVAAFEANAQMTLLALRPDGTLVWTAPLMPSNASVALPGLPGVAVGDDGTVYAPCFLGSSSPGLCSFAPDGSPTATFDAGYYQGVALPPSNDRVYALDKQLEAFTTDGALAWTSSGPVSVVPVVDDQGTLFLDLALQTTSMNAQGQPGWRAYDGAPVAMGADGTLYTIDLDGTSSHLTALAP